MNQEAFITTYNETRNGTDGFTRHSLVRSFAYSSGVSELAEIGCHWLVDILATELPAKFKENRHVSNQCIVKVKVKDSTALLTGEFTDNVVAWRKAIPYTDLPEGEWVFMVADEQEPPTPYRMVLISEY